MKELTIVKQQLPIVEVNFEEVKKEVNEQLTQYKSLVVTEESLSICKTNQKYLAGLKGKVDTYRKDIKRVMSEPITVFESKCKELVSLIESAEQPLKDGIKVFDDKKREEKRQTALQIIAEIIEKHEIKQKYAIQLTVLDKYMNLTSKINEVREDIEQRAFIILGQQQKEEEMLEIIQDTIDNANKTIKTPLHMNDFQRLIDRGISPKDIISEINGQAEKIRLAEMPKLDPIVEVSQLVQEVTPETPQTPITEVKEAAQLYRVGLSVIGTKKEIEDLAVWMRQNNYNYTTKSKESI